MTRALLVFERHPSACRAFLFPADATSPCASGQGSSMAEAKEALGKGRLPREAWVLDSRATLAPLELPAAGSSSEQLAGFARYELEPLLEDPAPHRFAAARLREGEAWGVALALPEHAWTENETDLRDLGHVLRGCAATQGAALALSPPDVLCLEAGPEGYALAELGPTGQLLRWDPGLEAGECASLMDPARSCVLLKEAREDEPEPELGEHERLAPPEGASVGAWGLATCLSGTTSSLPLLRAPKVPLWERSPLLVPAALALVFLLALGAGEFALRTRTKRLRSELASAQARADALRRSRLEAEQLRERFAEQTRRVERLRLRLGAAQASDQRGQNLAQLLTLLSTHLPEGVALTNLRDRGDSLLLRGFALDAASVQRLSRDLARELRGAGLHPLPARVQTSTNASEPGYRFVLEFKKPAPEPKAKARTRQTQRTRGGAPPRLPRNQVAGGAG